MGSLKNIFVIFTLMFCADAQAVTERRCQGSYSFENWTDCSGKHFFQTESAYDLVIAGKRFKGTLYEGDSYDGNWKNGLPHGYGKYTHSQSGPWSGDTFEGWFSYDRKEFGNYKHAKDGVTYYGQYEDGKRNGIGFFTDQSNQIRLFNFWSKGQPIKNPEVQSWVNSRQLTPAEIAALPFNGTIQAPKSRLNLYCEQKEGEGPKVYLSSFTDQDFTVAWPGYIVMKVKHDNSVRSTGLSDILAVMKNVEPALEGTNFKPRLVGKNIVLGQNFNLVDQHNDKARGVLDSLGANINFDSLVTIEKYEKPVQYLEFDGLDAVKVISKNEFRVSTLEDVSIHTEITDVSIVLLNGGVSLQSEETTKILGIKKAGKNIPVPTKIGSQKKLFRCKLVE